MKRQWTEEQLEFYKRPDIPINSKIQLMKTDLKKALEWLESEDYDTCFRLTSGVTEGLYINQDELLETVNR